MEIENIIKEILDLRLKGIETVSSETLLGYFNELNSIPQYNYVLNTNNGLIEKNNILEVIESIDNINIIDKKDIQTEENDEEIPFDTFTLGDISPEIDISNVSTVHTSPRKDKTIKYLVFHYTAGSNSRSGAAKNTCNVFLHRPASADFIVDDNNLVQYNADIINRYCWAVGDKGLKNSGGTLRGKCFNKNSISIEMCSSLKNGADWRIPNHDGWYFTDAVLRNAIKLGKILMKKYNIDISNVCRHYDVTGKLCPGVPGWNPEQGSGSERIWQWFKSRLI